MRRRELITFFGAAAIWPLEASAQLANRPIRIGLLPFGSPSNAYDQSLVDAFRSGLHQAGLIQDRDIVLDVVWTTGSDADTDKAVADLISRGAALLVPTGSTHRLQRSVKHPQSLSCLSASAIPLPWDWSKTLRIRAATPLVSATSFQT
jgi:hypothetical protein